MPRATARPVWSAPAAHTSAGLPLPTWMLEKATIDHRASGVLHRGGDAAARALHQVSGTISAGDHLGDDEGADYPSSLLGRR